LTVSASLLLLALLFPFTANASGTREVTQPATIEKAVLVEQCPRDMPKRCACVEYEGGIRVVPVLKARKGGAKILWIGPRPK
jgi:hypothetical protein